MTSTGAPPSGTVSFLFTDVEGSTSLWATDRDAMSASLAVHDQVLRSVVADHDGYVFSTAGDSFAVAFHRASDAVRAALGIQEELTAADWPGPALRVRMGAHLGEAEERGGDYFGPVVNTAARVEAAGHGGQVLITEMVCASAAVTDALDLGVRTLRDVPEPIRLFQVGAGEFPPLRVVDPELSNLPARPTRLLGRDTVVAQVRGLLADSRLVTVTAVGGAGKTRVAVAVGEAELSHRRDGVWFVDLTAVTTGAEVPGAVARAVGLSLMPGDPVEHVVDFLADKATLVILDNCEHVIDACAELAERFLARRGAAVLLATSREALDVEGEQTLVLASLETDGPDAPAVRLFVERASSLDPTFEPDEDVTATIAKICGRLDGMPLAVELAAARVAVMAPSELLDGLDRRFALLSGGRRRQRQRTLEATLDWSYRLLDPDEQRVLRSLGVFADGFDLDDVAAVADTTRADALDALDALVRKSLVVRADRGGLVRFRLLETVKAYAEDRLVDADEAGSVRDRHLGHLHRRATQAGPGVFGDVWTALALRADRRDIVGAIEWAAATNRWVTAGELLGGAAGVFDLELAWVDAMALLERVVAGCRGADPDLAEELRAVGLALRVGAFDPDLADHIVELAGSPSGTVRAVALSVGGTIAAMFGLDPDAAITAAQSEIDAIPDGHQAPSLASARAALALARGVAASAEDDLDGASTWFRRATQDTDGHAVGINLASGRAGTAVCQILSGDPAGGLETIASIESYELPQARGDAIRAAAHLAMGDLDAATVEIRAHAEHAASGRFPGETSDSLALLAALSRAEGDDDHAREVLDRVSFTRTPAGNVFAEHLARRLGVLDSLRERKLAWIGADRQVELARAMRELHEELSHRGWLRTR